MDLTGIENEAEFFPAGTLSDTLQDEIRDITSRWRQDDGGSDPVSRLARCAEPYLEALRRIRRATDRQRRIEVRKEATHTLLTALGYDPRPLSLHTALREEPVIPALGRVADADGRDVVWLLEAPTEDGTDDTADPLGVSFRPDQLAEDEREFAETEMAIEQILADGIFDLPDPPRFVLVFGHAQVALVDRNKWPARSVLRFDLQEIFSRQDQDTLAMTACLISREARAPHQGVPIADRIEGEAQRNANAVTASLKRTVRDAIEILGQEVLDVTRGRYPSGPRQGVWIEGPDLSRECLRYMYRLLFLFYAEANPRLNLLDLKDPVYASGYSLEALRELESVRLRSPAERDGTYLWESLQRTLGLLFQGSNSAMRLPAVKVSLLDPESTPILNAVKLRNEAVQKVIRLLSLKQTRSGTGRISYAKLGIGQLGAVYETLISLTGVVAKTDLIELRMQASRASADSDDDDGQEVEDGDTEEAAGPDDEASGAGEDDPVSRIDKIDLLAPSYFVPRSRAGEFKAEQIVFDGPEARVYPKGSFIYRLAGRDRQKSASYYTPEPLARLLVKHALMERCRDLDADAILELKILEPAMGSAAFLVETTNQLADLYLDRKQKELGETIPQDRIVIEKQKVRAFISDRNCFGVDLNPVAVELGAISLWLNSLHDGTFSPWFGDQLHAGNSLLGARRASYPPELMATKRKGDLWFNRKPQEIGWKDRLPAGHIWQFLLPAKDMARFDGEKSITPFAGDAQATIRKWRKSGFFDKLKPHEIKLLQKLSIIAEQLFDIVAEDLARSRAASNDAITLWPDKQMPGVTGIDFHEKARRIARMVGADRATNTLPYKRLKTAMDAWCALWFWPLDKAYLLPSRTEFLHGMAMILEGGFMPDGSLTAPSTNQFAEPAPDFFDQLEPDAPAKDLFRAAVKRQEGLFRETNVEALVETFDWLGVAADIAACERFTHFDLIFADVMRARGGFDLIVGNPPWAKPSWNEGLVLADIDPLYAGLSATDAKTILAESIVKAKVGAEFLKEFVSTRGAMEMTSSEVMQPYAGGGSNNLYRCFVDLSFRLVATIGNVGLLHQDGHLGDPNSGSFRRHWYARIAKHFHFRNEIKRKMFAEVHNGTEFSSNIYRGKATEPFFDQVSHVFLPSQIDESYTHDGVGIVEGIKGSDGQWNTRGHRDRVVRIDREALSFIHELSEDETVPVEEARFIQPFSVRTLDVFRRMARFSKLDSAIPRVERTVSTATGERSIQIALWQMKPLWHETSSQNDGIIERETAFRRLEEMVLQGPIFHVGNPLYKTPRTICQSNKAYDVINLKLISIDYVPRTNFGAAVNQTEFQRRMTKCQWDPAKSHADHYRVAFRRQIALNGERSLIPAIIPPSVTHVHGVESIAVYDEKLLINLASVTSSILYDFLIKACGTSDFHDSSAARLPWVLAGATACHRILRLTCLTSAYADLWDRHAAYLIPLPWSTRDTRLAFEGPVEGPVAWDRTAGLRTEFARRMALVEIDVLTAQALGLAFEQLAELYSIYFPTLKQYEAGTWYDQNGRIVWTNNSNGLPGIGFLVNGRRPGRATWEKILAQNPSELTCTAIDDTQPGGPREITRRFVGPFTTCDRIEDYKRAWAHFEAAKSREASV